ncbi:MAG TPA: PfaD family polyunsaturated fatty acid/polyketide biosynthesis protein [Thermoanaerobaculia bacterium]|nr:PfaD family polyunsaturated fatty acid/polyketide biosynthesis protein [Thermoanaerobaculia bacterium]
MPATEEIRPGGGRSLRPEQLGAESFRRRHGLRYAYVTGAMYQGIASKELVTAVARAGFLGFLGTGGRSLEEIERDLVFLRQELGSDHPYGMNLIAQPQEPEMEEATVDLYRRHGVTCVEAAAFTRMTPALVHYRLSGVERSAGGGVTCRHRVIAKVSRPELAEAFLSPPPQDIVRKLLAAERITGEQAALAAEIAMSDDLCVEADSGGHTDRGNATVLLPAMQSVVRRIAARRRFEERIHVGLAGGIGTPQAAAAAFLMGADFILTGSINQCTVEAGTSDAVKDLLQAINVQDTDYAPAGDMFEQGSRVQVLRKGVLFPARANKLYALYSRYDAWEEIPERVRMQIESTYFARPFAEVWDDVREHHRRKGRHALVDQASADGKRKMALVFRWYFAMSSRAAISGDETRLIDFQVHTGPALGAFNQWVKGTELESWRNRRVAGIAERLMQETAALLDQRFHDWMSMSHTTGESAQ